MIYFLSPLNFFDSAQNDNLQIHEEKSKGVYVKNLTDYYVSSAREVYEIMRQGGAARVVTSTSKLRSLPFQHKFVKVVSLRHER
jgi:kinesin family protein 5